MTTPSDKNSQNNPLSSFGVGVAIGVVAALLFGTEEGRKLVKKAIDAIPDKYKPPPVTIPQMATHVSSIPVEETPHHVDFNYEAPPPPAPHVKPSLAEPFVPQVK